MIQPGAGLHSSEAALQVLAKGIPRNEHEQYPDWKERIKRGGRMLDVRDVVVEPMFVVSQAPVQTWTYTGSALSGTQA